MCCDLPQERWSTEDANEPKVHVETYQDGHVGYHAGNCEHDDHHPLVSSGETIDSKSSREERCTHDAKDAEEYLVVDGT